MAKPVPLRWGQFYHIYNRGIDRQPIFFQERNYRYFLQLYTRHVHPIVVIHLVAYIHRNAQKHGLVEEFDTWPYSSYHTILTAQPTLIQRTGVLDWFGGVAPFRAFHEGDVTEGRLTPLVEDDFD